MAAGPVQTTVAKPVSSLATGPGSPATDEDEPVSDKPAGISQPDKDPSHLNLNDIADSEVSIKLR